MVSVVEETVSAAEEQTVPVSVEEIAETVPGG
jgi:hypothetical protein